MTKIFAQNSEVMTTGTMNSWINTVNTPMAVALVFALAGSFFVAIYFLRVRRKK